MNVRELMERLEEENPNAEVRLMMQQQWPFEYSVYGICSSSQLVDEDEEEEMDEDQLEEEDTGRGLEDDDHPERRLQDRHPSTGITDKPDVVFLVEGTQLSYGNKNAWEVAR